MKYNPNAMKFGIRSMSSSLIINMIFEIADLYPKLKTWADLVSKLQYAWFLWNLTPKQIKHTNYEYNTRQCLECLHDY